MSDQKAAEFTPAYAADVKKRFEDLEATVKAIEAFAKALGYSPAK